MKRLIAAALLLLSTSAFTVQVGVGGYATMPISQQGTDGSRNIFNVSPLLYLSHSYNIGGPHFFMPRVGMVYHLGTGDNYTKMTWIASVDYGLILSNNFILHVGIGTHMVQISGAGNAVTVNNGTGYKIAHQPSDTAVSYTLVQNLGLEIIIDPQWSAEIELYSLGIFNDFGYAISFNRFF